MAEKRKKILVASPSRSNGGAERVMLNVAVGLSGMGYGIDFVLKNDFARNRYEVPESLPMHSLEAGGLLDTTLKLARRIRASKPDVVITALETLGFAAVLAKKLLGCRTRVVPTVHTMLATLYREVPSAHNRRYRTMLKLLYPRADRIVAVSQGVKMELLELLRVPESKVSVLYNPVITEQVLEAVREPVEHPWFGSGKKVAVAVGRLTRAKNYPLMLRALAEARKSVDLHLIILGDGELKEQLEAEARALGVAHAVDLHGFVPNPMAYVAAADVFVLSSSWEGLGNVLIEALPAGTPIVSTDCESGPREVLSNGKWGVLVPTDDHRAMAEAMTRVVTEPRPEIRPESWLRFGLAGSVQCYASLIETL